MHSSGYPDLSSNARLGGIRRLHLVCQRQYRALALSGTTVYEVEALRSAIPNG
jgi:hypothetical protein